MGGVTKGLRMVHEQSLESPTITYKAQSRSEYTAQKSSMYTMHTLKHHISHEILFPKHQFCALRSIFADTRWIMHHPHRRPLTLMLMQCLYLLRLSSLVAPFTHSWAWCHPHDSSQSNSISVYYITIWSMYTYIWIYLAIYIYINMYMQWTSILSF